MGARNPVEKSQRMGSYPGRVQERPRKIECLKSLNMFEILESDVDIFSTPRASLLDIVLWATGLARQRVEQTKNTWSLIVGSQLNLR